MFMLFRKTPNPGGCESLPGFIKRGTIMCDMKNTTEDGRCMDARKGECKWYVDGKCKKKEVDDGTKSQKLAKVRQNT